VIAAEDKLANVEEERFVAIKKIERTFEHRFYAKRTLRELKILRNLKHENVRQYYFKFKDCESISNTTT
jgi:mitogen-activated protein kinase 1/3